MAAYGKSANKQALSNASTNSSNMEQIPDLACARPRGRIEAVRMESYVFKYKVRRFAARLWYWTRQLLIIGLLLGAFVLAWKWQDQTAERVTTGKGESVHIVDGDTLTIGSANQLRTIRIEGIDAPEYRQTCRDDRGMEWLCGKEARKVLEEVVKPGGLECRVDANDTYHRTIGLCSVTGTKDIGREMVRRGMAVSGASTSDSRFNTGGPYLTEEAQAQQAKRGIWRGTFERPADWRANTKSAANKADADK